MRGYGVPGVRRDKCQVHVLNARCLAGTLLSGLLSPIAGLYAGFESESFFHLVVVAPELFFRYITALVS